MIIRRAGNRVHVGGRAQSPKRAQVAHAERVVGGLKDARGSRGDLRHRGGERGGIGYTLLLAHFANNFSLSIAV